MTKVPPPWIRKTSLAVSAVLAVLFLTQCVSFRKSDQEVAEYFKNEPVKPALHSIIVDQRAVHYAEIGADSLPVVVFVHGSPGSWTAFIDFFKDSTLYRRAHLVAVDRLGFGQSGHGKVEISIQKQARAVAEVITKVKPDARAILVGHSLGGPVIARLAMDYPERVGGLILVAGSVDPALEKKKWYRPILAAFPLRYLIPTDFDVSNREIWPLKEELTAMLPLWEKIKVPVIVIQGEDDGLVPPGNAAFAQRMLTNAPVTMRMIPDMNHFIPWRRPDFIREAILEMVEE